jgi:DNA-binding GntR family transcriptional regulator
MPADLSLAPSEETPLNIAVPWVTPPLYEQAYDSILEAICGGVLRPGDRINQDELAARLKVSRQPVTQALTVLKTQDFVQDTGRRGLVVAPLRRSFFEALYQLRESLDPTAAKLAARKHIQLSPEAGQALLQRGRSAMAVGSIAELTAADMAFHVWLYEAAGNPLLLETLRLYWNHLRRAMTAVIGPPPDRSRVWEEHAAILQAVLAGDELQAERLSLAHIQGAAKRVIQSLPE